MLLFAVGIAAVLALFMFTRARARHIRRLRAEVLGEVPVSGGLRAALAKVFNVDTAELTTVGAVTFADLAWQYSLADPQIWDHFQGPAADHIVNAIQNMDVLRSALGVHAQNFLPQMMESLKHIEATQLFQELAEKVPMLEAAGNATAVAAAASTHAAVDALASAGSASLEAKGQVVGTITTAAGDGSLLHHIPLITIGFATYRAWRRAQQGAELKRNVEFAAIEVGTRAGGALVGGQLGGVIGTAVVPGVGTILGGVVGAIGGTIAGMRLGEDIKKRHVRQARQQFDDLLAQLGREYLEDPIRYQQLSNVFVEHEREYMQSLKETRRRLRRYASPLRVLWPDQKLILLQETVRLAENRIGSVRQGTVEALERLDFMQVRGQNHELGVILWSNPALREQVKPDSGLVVRLEETQLRLARELAQHRDSDGPARTEGAPA